MNCPQCDTDTKVIETFPDVEERHRLRKCKACGFRFLTQETVVPISELVDLHRYKNAKRRAEMKEV